MQQKMEKQKRYGHLIIMENINEKINNLNEFFRFIKDRDNKLIELWLYKRNNQ